VDLDTFWQIVEDARGSADPVSGSDAVADGVVGRLVTLPPDEIVEFDVVFQQVRSHAFRWDVWAAASVVNAGCTDDRFLDFLGWLAAQGRKVWDSALADPDSLADILDRPDRPGAGSLTFTFCEPMAFAASQAHAQVTGDDEAFWQALDARDTAAADGGTDDADERSSGPAGDPIDFADAAQLQARLPRLSRLYLAG
jgi:hypothetical protein